MFRLSRFVLFCFLTAIGERASAHFIWIVCTPTPKATSQVHVYFSESPEPGEPALIGKIATSKLWSRNAEGKEQSLSVARAADAKSAELTTALPGSEQPFLEATCDYGVYQHGATAMLLDYHAKYLPPGWSRRPDKLNLGARLALDVVPRVDDHGLVLKVTFRGSAIGGAELITIDGAAATKNLMTDSNGLVRIETPAAGKWAIRAMYVEKDKSGERDGKPYTQIMHCATAVFELPSLPAKESAKLTARQLLARARAARSMWKNFPGFTADLIANEDGKEIKGKVAIDSSGNVALEMPKSALTDWVDEELESMVQHRMPDGAVREGEVKFADDDTTHPLGRKISLGDADRESSYRILDDTIMEVTRTMGGERFTISVLEVDRNPEGAYLPRSFTMNFFDAASGKLVSSRSYWNGWQRVGKLDLPKTILVVETQPSKIVTRRISFSNEKLQHE